MPEFIKFDPVPNSIVSRIFLYNHYPGDLHNKAIQKTVFLIYFYNYNEMYKQRIILL